MVAAAEAGGFFVSEARVACVDGDDVVGFLSWRGAFVIWPYVAPRRRPPGAAGGADA